MARKVKNEKVELLDCLITKKVRELAETKESRNKERLLVQIDALLEYRHLIRGTSDA